jgi:hypothetical protein
MADFLYQQHMIQITVTGCDTQGLSYTHVKITAAIILRRVSFMFFDCVCVIVVFVGTTNEKKKKMRSLKFYLWSEHNGERAVTEAVCTASQLCSAPWVSYVLGRTLMRSQPKGVKLKMRGRKLKSCVNCTGALKQKA